MKSVSGPSQGRYGEDGRWQRDVPVVADDVEVERVVAGKGRRDWSQSGCAPRTEAE